MNTPIYDFVRAYAEKKGVRFHMPGHKGKGPLGVEAMDITEIGGADVLGEANGIIGESEKNASALFRTGRTVYTTGGSTAAILAMLFLATQRYRSAERPLLLASRGAHRAFLQGAALLDIPVSFVLPENAKTIYSGVMSADEVARAIEEAPQKPYAFYITSPNYLGELWDIRGVADVCERHGVALLVDNAHGAYLAHLSPSLHPIHLGAVMCADSAHKTLPVLTGGAYLHIAKGWEADFANVKSALSLFSSTSPSYLTLASLDLANRTLADGYAERLADTVKRITATKAALQKAGFCLPECEPLRIVICDARAEVLADALRASDIECEFVDRTHLVLMASAENDPTDFDVLERVLLPLAEDAEIPAPPPKPSLGIPALSLREALFAQSEEVSIAEAVGRIYADISAACPPAVPIAICGERITEKTVRALRYYGIDKLRVIKNR